MSYELRVERKFRVGNSKVRVETKLAGCLFSSENRGFFWMFTKSVFSYDGAAENFAFSANFPARVICMNDESELFIEACS